MYTNFSQLTTEQKTIWSLDMWKQARNMSFINKFMGSDANSLIQHITELKKTEKGARAVITLLTDLEGDGVAGDRTLEGNEEALKSFDQVIRIDQLRHANRHEGRMGEQKSIVNFRTDSRDTLAYWLSDRMDQLAFLTMAGIGYQFKNAGGIRVGSDLQFLDFAADVSAPTSKRFGRYNNTSKLMEWGVGTSAITATDTPAWEMLVQAKAYAKDNYIRGIRSGGNEEIYHVFVSPTAMARLKLDPTYLQNLRQAGPRDSTNQLFKGGNGVLVDGLYISEFRHVPNTRLAAAGSKYGAGGTIDGCQILFCGAQALGMADIGAPEWVEKEFDFGNQQAISTGKIMGFLKPKFVSQYSGGTTEDFGVLSLYAAQ